MTMKHTGFPKEDSRGELVKTAVFLAIETMLQRMGFRSPAKQPRRSSDSGSINKVKELAEICTPLLTGFLQYDILYLTTKSSTNSEFDGTAKIQYIFSSITKMGVFGAAKNQKVVAALGFFLGWRLLENGKKYIFSSKTPRKNHICYSANVVFSSK